MIDYSDIFRSQAESLNTADMEGILRAADAPGGGAEFQREGNRAEHVVGRRRGQSGESTGSAENHVFRRNPGLVSLAAQLICICIAAGILSSFASGFGSGTASGMSSVICSFMAAGICLTAFYNIYQGSLGAVSAMTNLMSVSLPVIFAVTAVSGGASSRSGAQRCSDCCGDGFFRLGPVYPHADGIRIGDFFCRQQRRKTELYQEKRRNFSGQPQFSAWVFPLHYLPD